MMKPSNAWGILAVILVGCMFLEFFVFHDPYGYVAAAIGALVSLSTATILRVLERLTKSS